MATHKPYTGTEKSLVIGIDVGTILSSVSYALLEPGKVPRILPVTRFFGQREEENNSQVPSVVCYGQDGNVIATGSEADEEEEDPVLSEIEGVRRAEWFKLRLRPPHLAADQLEKIWSPLALAGEIDDHSEASDENEHENNILLDIEGVGAEVIELEAPNKKKIPRPITDFNTAVQAFADLLQSRLWSPHLVADKRSQLERIWSPLELAGEIDDHSETSDENEYENNILLDIEGVGAEVVELEAPNKKRIPHSITDDFNTAVQAFADLLQSRLWPPHLAADKRSQFERIWSPLELAEENDEYTGASDEDQSDTLLDIEGIGAEVVEPESPNKKKIPRPITDNFSKTTVQAFTDFLQLHLWPPHLAVDKRSQLERIWSPLELGEENEYTEAFDGDQSENHILLDIEGVGAEVVEPESPKKKRTPRPITDFKTTVQAFADFLQLRLWPHPAADKRSQLERIWSPLELAEENDEYTGTSDEFQSENYILLDIEGVGAEVVEPESPNKENAPRPITDDFKTAVQVLADFLQYLFKSAKEYIIEKERHLDPTFTWYSIERNTYFVLTHPNGWEGKQQSQMREAAIVAGLVDRSTAVDRISFVTEGEANLHSYLDKNPALHQEGSGLSVVDCGGGTIDLSAYSQIKKGDFKEIVLPDCLLQGSIFVTARARDYFKARFRGSQFGTDNDIEDMVKAFDKFDGAKCMFRDPSTPHFVTFGGLRDNDQKYGISRGRFTVEGAQVAKFFEPAVQDIIDGILNQRRNAKDGVSIKYVLLTGGFGRSDYLYTRLCDHFKSSDIIVLRPDSTNLTNVVADGAVSWYLDRYVSTRVARFSYGVMTRHLFNGQNPDHLGRERTKVTQANGKSYIPGIFATILKKDSEVSEETQFRQPHKLILTRGQFAGWSTISTRLKCYRGKATDPPKWVDREPGSFRDACTIQADMSHIKPNMRLHKSGTKLFYKLDLEVMVLFGFTELKAYVTWKENGVEKRTTASIFYD